jgi:hypothetical protein
MQEAAAKSELLDLINLLPMSETNTVKTFIEFVIEKNNSSRVNRPKPAENAFDKFTEYSESRPVEKRLTKKEKESIQKSREEYKKGETISFDEYKRLRREKRK